MWIVIWLLLIEFWIKGSGIGFPDYPPCFSGVRVVVWDVQDEISEGEGSEEERADCFAAWRRGSCGA